MPYGRRRYGGPRVRRSTKPAVMTSTGVQAKKRSKCAGCGQHIQVGEAFTRLRLTKRYAHPCGTCHVTPKRAKRFHPTCVPADINTAMGFDPSAVHSAAPASRGGAVPPPPMPKTFEDVALESLVLLEAALILKVQRDRKTLTPDFEKQFKTFQGIKARVLRPGTLGEGEVATSIALQRIIKMVFA